MVEAILSLMLTLAPRAPEERIRPLAHAIDTVAESHAERVELVTLAFVETTLGRRGVPFGCTDACRRLTDRSLPAMAHRALRVLRRGREVCGPSVVRRMDFYRRGVCRGDYEAQRRARIVRRLLIRPSATR